MLFQSTDDGDVSGNGRDETNFEEIVIGATFKLGKGS